MDIILSLTLVAIFFGYMYNQFSQNENPLRILSLLLSFLTIITVNLQAIQYSNTQTLSTPILSIYNYIIIISFAYVFFFLIKEYLKNLKDLQ